MGHASAYLNSCNDKRKRLITNVLLLLDESMSWQPKKNLGGCQIMPSSQGNLSLLALCFKTELSAHYDVVFNMQSRMPNTNTKIPSFPKRSPIKTHEAEALRQVEGTRVAE